MSAFFNQIGGMDCLAIAAVAFLVIRGFIRGCSGEIGRLVSVVTAAGVGYLGYGPVARAVLSAKLFEANPYAGRLIAFILMLVVCIAVWLGLRQLLSEGIKLVLAQPFDAIVGGVLGGIKAFILVAVLCTLGLLNPREADRNHFKEKSVTAQKLAPYLKRITSP